MSYRDYQNRFDRSVWPEPGAAAGRACVPWPRPPRYRIERASRGYRVVGEGTVVWEETLREAAQCREELVGATAPAAAAPAPGALPEATVSAAIAYGPVASRRFGRSLGIDLTPRGCRACNFDCIYCEFGDVPRAEGCVRWPSPGDVRHALMQTLGTADRIDSITISGHGEPTLHPDFAAATAEILGEARRSRSDVPVRILTNGTLATCPSVRRALDQLDERIVVVDAAAGRVNRPARGCPLGALVAGLLLLRDVSVQSCFIGGAVSNCDPSCVAAWAELVAELRPRRVQIHTINHRPARADVRPLACAQLEEIACVLRARTGIEADVYA